MTIYPILTRDVARRIYRSTPLANRLVELEQRGAPENHIESLADLVNTRLSRGEPLSRWVRYREGYAPALVSRLMELFPVESPDSFVLDPMCGSGSTQVAAQSRGLKSVGSDVSPYAVLVSESKTQPWGAADADAVRAALATLQSEQPPDPALLGEEDAFLAKFFPEESFTSLIAIRQWIAAREGMSAAAQRLLKVGLLAIVEDVSNRRKDGNGLATRSSSLTDVPGAYAHQLEMMLSDLRTLPLNRAPSVSQVASALDLDSTIAHGRQAFGSELGAVIFSPPYANSFDYFESYKLELLFGQFFTRESLASARGDLLRSYRQSGKSTPVVSLGLVELVVDEIMSRLPAKEAQRGAPDGRSRLLPNLLRGYFADMRSVLETAYGHMPSGCRMHIVVDQSAYLGVLLPTDLLLADIAETLGFDYTRLLICRRAKTSAQQLQSQPLLGDVLRESVVVLTKP